MLREGIGSKQQSLPCIVFLSEVNIFTRILSYHINVQAIRENILILANQNTYTYVPKMFIETKYSNSNKLDCSKPSNSSGLPERLRQIK